MKALTTTALVAAIAGLSACSQPDAARPSWQGEGFEKTPPQISNIGDVFDEASWLFGEVALTAQDKYKISKMPQMQGVTVRAGTNMAEHETEVKLNAPYWNEDLEQNWGIELPNGEYFILTQAGPQFYEGEAATLIRHGLNVTLIK